MQMLVDSRITFKPIKTLNTLMPDSLKGWKWCCGELLKDCVCVREKLRPTDRHWDRWRGLPLGAHSPLPVLPGTSENKKKMPVETITWCQWKMKTAPRTKVPTEHRALEVTELSLIFRNKIPSLETSFQYNFTEMMHKEEQAWMLL